MELLAGECTCSLKTTVLCPQCATAIELMNGDRDLSNKETEDLLLVFKTDWVGDNPQDLGEVYTESLKARNWQSNDMRSLLSSRIQPYIVAEVHIKRAQCELYRRVRDACKRTPHRRQRWSNRQTSEENL